MAESAESRKRRASIGGKARAAALSPEERKEISGRAGRARAAALSPAEKKKIAKKAAAARWGHGLPKATHGSAENPLRIGDVEIPCYVLEDGRRVITNQGLQIALQMARSGGQQRTATFVASLERKGVDCKDLLNSITNPIRFRPSSGVRAYGYEATVLADLCDVILSAREKGALDYQQRHIGAQCEVLVRAFARVGIIALVDEATGFQRDRARRALHEILEQFISKDLMRWAKRFPDEFYEEMFRLKGWPFKADSSVRPLAAGHVTNNLVYKRLAPGVLDELRRLTPRDKKGRLKQRYHQRLTQDVGHPRLREHLSAVIALMRAADDWDGFYRMLERSLPKQVAPDGLAPETTAP